MTAVATHDTQAIVLLCAPIAVGDAKPLTPSEWAKLASAIHASELHRPGALVGLPSADLADGLGIETGLADRIAALLDRGGTLAFELERLESRGIWVVTRSDDEYPELLRKRLGLRAPAVLFGAGRREVVAGVGVAVVGSRDASADALELAEDLGRSAARERATIVSGAARGVDRTAMNGAMEIGGSAVGVVPDGLVRMTQQPDVRSALADERLTLVTPYPPEARFNVGYAMGRNKLIYCLADAAVVVATSTASGGTWAGAIENLKAGWVPLWVWDSPSAPPGNRELLALGGRALGRVSAVEELIGDGEEAGEPNRQIARTASSASETESATKTEASDLAALLPVLLLYLETPRTESDVCGELGLGKGVARQLLKGAVASGRVTRSGRPFRYFASRQLFDQI